LRHPGARLFLLVALLAATTAAKPVVTVYADDVMDSPQPKAPLGRWTDSPGRHTIALDVPGATLRGYAYHGGSPNAPVLVMFGGSGNLIARHDGAARGFARFASRVVFFDYRGYGFSTGKARFADLDADALRIYDSVAKETGARVVVLGYSMGTAVAAYVAVRRPVAGIILCAPWNDYATTSEFTDPNHSFVLAPDAQSLLDEAAMLKHVRAPLLVLQGTLDDAIPPQEGPALERGAASPDKRFVPIVGVKHSGLLEDARTQIAVQHFLAR
jgi:uncharacterized protein